MCAFDASGNLPIPYVDQLEVLGTMLSKTGDTGIAVEHRLKKAEGHYWSEPSLFYNQDLCLAQRFRNYAES